VAKLPEEVLVDNPDLYRQYCRALVDIIHPSAEAALDNLGKMSHGDTNLQGELAVMRMVLLRPRGDIVGTKTLAEQALSLLSSDNMVMRNRVTYILGMVKCDQYFFDEALLLLTEAANAGRRSGDYWTATGALQNMARIFSERGELHKAILTLQEAIQLGGDSPAGATPRSILSRILYEQNQLDLAIENAALSVKWCYLGRDVGPVCGYIYGALAKLAQGDLTGATDVLKAADTVATMPTTNPYFKARHAAGHVEFAIRNDDLDTALNWGKRLAQYADFLTIESVHVSARLLIAEGEKERAADELRRIYEKMMLYKCQGLSITVRVCQALAASTETEALTYLSEALISAEPKGYIRTFLDEGKVLIPLLQKLLNQGIVPEYSHKLIDIIELEERQRRTSNGISTLSTLYSGTLSPRELEVLHLIAEGLSNRQIADRLVISLGTVKTHVHNIFEKLSVNTRTQALAQARKLGLV
jgi:LuxR family transcriptional regulator, maltose regulon positive regulatory protein